MDKCELDCLVEELISIHSIMTHDLNDTLLAREAEMEQVIQEISWDLLVHAWTKADKIRNEKEMAYESEMVHGD